MRLLGVLVSVTGGVNGGALVHAYGMGALILAIPVAIIMGAGVAYMEKRGAW